MREHHITNNWAIGLSSDQTSALREALGEEHGLIAYTEAGAAAHSGAMPFLIWADAKSCRELAALPEDIGHELEATPKVLVLGPDYSLDDLDTACDCGITEILRPPLSRERIADIMRRALEMQAIHHDIDCMAREIALERELLERKNEILSFLVNFLTNVTENLDLDELLRHACQGLGRLLPVKALHAALWDKNNGGAPNLTLCIAAPERSAAHEAWKDLLLKQAASTAGPLFSTIDIQTLSLDGPGEHSACRTPDNGYLLSLPLLCGSEQLGVLLLLTSMERNLGRDQSLALESAMRHFSLTLKNARRFRLLQMYADYDALTKVHSRRHFENRLEEELQRHVRYGGPLSLIMLDIDRFKSINDTHGHHTGDLVLSEVAGLVAASVRNTDCCARYGGEEFVVLLPHTDGKKALGLAERIRKKIAAHTFTGDKGDTMAVTVSLGVSSLDEKTEARSLLCNADAAMYAAKSGGRNRSCFFNAKLPRKPEPLAACQAGV